MSLFGLFGPPNVEKLQAKGDVKGLIKALKYKKGKVNAESGKVRRAAATALGQIGDPRAVDPLIAALTDSYSDVRQRAATALGQIGDPRAVDLLIAALTDNYSDVRQCAAIALGQIGDPRAVDPLIVALEDRHSDVRQNAEMALVKIGAPAVTADLLLVTLRHRDKNIHAPYHVANVLDSIGWHPDKTENGAYYWIVKEQWDKCVEIGAMAVDPLIAVLQGNEGHFYGKVVLALGQIGDSRAVKPLVAKLRFHEKNVRHSTAMSLLTIYKSGKLDFETQQIILAHRQQISEKHTDNIRHEDMERHGSDCRHDDARVHIDQGIGIEFPI